MSACGGLSHQEAESYLSCWGPAKDHRWLVAIEFMLRGLEVSSSCSTALALSLRHRTTVKFGSCVMQRSHPVAFGIRAPHVRRHEPLDMHVEGALVWRTCCTCKRRCASAGRGAHCSWLRSVSPALLAQASPILGYRGRSCLPGLMDRQWHRNSDWAHIARDMRRSIRGRSLAGGRRLIIIFDAAFYLSTHLSYGWHIYRKTHAGVCI